jgi:hypothetical protein
LGGNQAYEFRPDLPSIFPHPDNHAVTDGNNHLKGNANADTYVHREYQVQNGILDIPQSGKTRAH